MASVTILRKWGDNSWLVETNVRYQNSRPPHVEVGKNLRIQMGQVYGLNNLHIINGKALAWNVVGLVNIKHRQFPAHFTVYYGDDAAEKLDYFNAIVSTLHVHS